MSCYQKREAKVERGWEKKVLDNGYVKLIDHMGSDEDVVEAARMSTGRGFISWDPYLRCEKCEEVFLGEQDGPSGLCPKLGQHTWKRFPRGDFGLMDTLFGSFPPHSTPFECGGELHIEVMLPIAVVREWHRHRTQSFNEMSGRYIQMPDLHYVPELSRFQKQSKTNKQGSAGVIDEAEAHRHRNRMIEEQRDVYSHYDEMVTEEVAKEVARFNTPVSRYTRMRAKTDLLNWLKFLDLRTRKEAMYEIRVYAQVVAEIIQSLWPRTFALFEEYNLYGTRLSRTERKLLVGLLEKAYQEASLLNDQEQRLIKKIANITY